MRRSVHLRITVLCPHYVRPVEVTRNEATERLVDCSSKNECARTEPAEGGGERGVTVTYPVGCPVFGRS